MDLAVDLVDSDGEVPHEFSLEHNKTLGIIDFDPMRDGGCVSTQADAESDWMLKYAGATQPFTVSSKPTSTTSAAVDSVRSDDKTL